MEFFKQKGPLTKDVCDTLLYVIAVQSLKPATLRDTLTASQWSGMCFFLWHFSLSSLWKCCPIYCWLQIAALHGKH